MSKEMLVNEGASTSKATVSSGDLSDADSDDTTNSITTAKGAEKDFNDITSKALEGWSKTEKLQLYKALKNYGSSDISTILCEVPTKSSMEIRHVIEQFKNLIEISAVVESKERSDNKPNKYSSPLTNWANLLTENMDISESQNEIAETLRIYANFGNIPAPHLTDNVNFRDLYLLLADAMDGKPLTSSNSMHKQIIKECITNASLFSSEIVKNSEFESIFQNMDIDALDAFMFTKPTSDEELSCLRHLISQKKFNPFNLSEEDLKKAFDFKNKINK